MKETDERTGESLPDVELHHAFFFQKGEREQFKFAYPRKYENEEMIAKRELANRILGKG